MGKLIGQSRGEVKICSQIARYYAENFAAALTNQLAHLFTGDGGQLFRTAINQISQFVQH
jgi:hypothetical protein